VTAKGAAWEAAAGAATLRSTEDWTAPTFAEVTVDAATTEAAAAAAAAAADGDADDDDDAGTTGSDCDEPRI
jgi:hypothetical protein